MVGKGVGSQTVTFHSPETMDRMCSMVNVGSTGIPVSSFPPALLSVILFLFLTWRYNMIWPIIFNISFEAERSQVFFLSSVYGNQCIGRKPFLITLSVGEVPRGYAAAFITLSFAPIGLSVERAHCVVMVVTFEFKIA